MRLLKVTNSDEFGYKFHSTGERTMASWHNRITAVAIALCLGCIVLVAVVWWRTADVANTVDETFTGLNARLEKATKELTTLRQAVKKKATASTINDLKAELATGGQATQVVQ